MLINRSNNNENGNYSGLAHTIVGGRGGGGDKGGDRGRGGILHYILFKPGATVDSLPTTNKYQR